MRILVTSMVDLKRSAPGRLHWFVKHLSLRHEITVLSINDWWKANLAGNERYQDGFSLGDVTLSYLSDKRSSPVMQELTSPWRVPRWLGRGDRRFDVHYNYNTLVSGYSAARNLRPQHVPTVYDLADDLPRQLGESLQIPVVLRGAARLVGKSMLRRNQAIAARVLFNTPKLRDQYPVPTGKSEVLPNGVDIELFRPGPGATKQTLGLEGAFVLGFVGTIREWTDFRPVFAAVKQLEGSTPPVKLLIVGDEGGMGRAKKLAAEYGVAGAAVFTGTVPQVEVANYVNCMDAGVMPLTFDDCQPLAVLQYMACGKPVIATRALQVPDSLVIYASDAAAYHRQIGNLMASPERRHDLGQRGRQYVVENHDWAKLAGRLERLLAEVAAVSTPRSP